MQRPFGLGPRSFLGVCSLLFLSLCHGCSGVRVNSTTATLPQAVTGPLLPYEDYLEWKSYIWEDTVHCSTIHLDGVRYNGFVAVAGNVVADVERTAPVSSNHHHFRDERLVACFDQGTSYFSCHYLDLNEWGVLDLYEGGPPFSVFNVEECQPVANPDPTCLTACHWDWSFEYSPHSWESHGVIIQSTGHRFWDIAVGCETMNSDDDNSEISMLLRPGELELSCSVPLTDTNGNILQSSEHTPESPIEGSDSFCSQACTVDEVEHRGWIRLRAPGVTNIRAHEIHYCVGENNGAYVSRLLCSEVELEIIDGVCRAYSPYTEFNGKKLSIETIDSAGGGLAVQSCSSCYDGFKSTGPFCFPEDAEFECEYVGSGDFDDFSGVKCWKTVDGVQTDRVRGGYRGLSISRVDDHENPESISIGVGNNGHLLGSEVSEFGSVVHGSSTPDGMNPLTSYGFSSIEVDKDASDVGVGYTEVEGVRIYPLDGDSSTVGSMRRLLAIEGAETLRYVDGDGIFVNFWTAGEGIIVFTNSCDTVNVEVYTSSEYPGATSLEYASSVDVNMLDGDVVEYDGTPFYSRTIDWGVFHGVHATSLVRACCKGTLRCTVSAETYETHKGCERQKNFVLKMWCITKVGTIILGLIVFYIIEISAIVALTIFTYVPFFKPITLYGRIAAFVFGYHVFFGLYRVLKWILLKLYGAIKLSAKFVRHPLKMWSFFALMLLVSPASASCPKHWGPGVLTETIPLGTSHVKTVSGGYTVSSTTNSKLSTGKMTLGLSDRDNWKHQSNYSVEVIVASASVVPNLVYLFDDPTALGTSSIESKYSSCCRGHSDSSCLCASAVNAFCSPEDAPCAIRNHPDLTTSDLCSKYRVRSPESDRSLSWLYTPQGKRVGACGKGHNHPQAICEGTINFGAPKRDSALTVYRIDGYNLEIVVMARLKYLDKIISQNCVSVDSATNRKIKLSTKGSSSRQAVSVDVRLSVSSFDPFVLSQATHIGFWKKNPRILGKGSVLEHYYIREDPGITGMAGAFWLNENQVSPTGTYLSGTVGFVKCIGLKSSDSCYGKAYSGSDFSVDSHTCSFEAGTFADEVIKHEVKTVKEGTPSFHSSDRFNNYTIKFPVSPDMGSMLIDVESKRLQPVEYRSEVCYRVVPPNKDDILAQYGQVGDSRVTFKTERVDGMGCVEGQFFARLKGGIVSSGVTACTVGTKCTVEGVAKDIGTGSATIETVSSGNVKTATFDFDATLHSYAKGQNSTTFANNTLYEDHDKPNLSGLGNLFNLDSLMGKGMLGSATTLAIILLIGFMAFKSRGSILPTRRAKIE